MADQRVSRHQALSITSLSGGAGTFYGNLFVGGPPSDKEQNFHGMIDEFRVGDLDLIPILLMVVWLEVWNRIIPDSQIRRNLYRILDPRCSPVTPSTPTRLEFKQRMCDDRGVGREGTTT